MPSLILATGDTLAFSATERRSAGEAARVYARAGFYVLPVPFMKKGCCLLGWQDLRLTEPQLCVHFDGSRQNIAVLTGIDGLTDIDCDSAEAISTASVLLPTTAFVFGRPSKPASHYFYFSDAGLRSEQFKDPVTGGMILEVRCAKADGGVGLQTCVPPSTHTTGESIRFEDGHDGWPATVRADDLRQATRKAAAAALLARYWPGQGSRHEAFLALAGALGRAGWSLEEASQFHRAIYTVLWPDAPDLQRCAKEVESSFARLQDPQTATTGVPTLCGLIDERVVKRALEWLEIGTSPRGTAAVETGSADRLARLEKYVFDPDHEPPAERVYFENFLAEGDLVVWLGREKHRKTNFLLQCAISAAAGRDFLVFPCSSGPLRVAVIDYETKSRSLWQRFCGICKALNLSQEECRLLRQNLCVVEARKLVRAGQNLPRFVVRGGRSSSDIDQAVARSEKFWRNFAEAHPADIYVFDPLRSMHSENENDSNIESLLVKLRQSFPNAAVIVAHHMRKYALGAKEVTLQEDMRLWSDGARGSTAIKAHADVIVCQERTMAQQDEIVHLGAFLKDGPDIEPLPFEETDAQSFCWQVRPDVPAHLNVTLDRLKHEGPSFADVNAAVKLLVGNGVKRPTAYRHVAELSRLNILRQEGGRLVLSEAAKVKYVKTPD